METKPKTIIIRITQEQHDKLMWLVQETGQSVSELVRDMVENYVPIEIKKEQ